MKKTVPSMKTTENVIIDESEKESEKWIKSNTKPCPKCLTPIIRNNGCNHMTCRTPMCLYGNTIFIYF